MTLGTGLSSTEVAKQLRAQLGAKINQPLFAYERVVRTSATRVRNWSRVYSFDALGIVEIEIYAAMDERTCEICREMDGKIFRVEDVIEHIETVLDAPVDDLPDLNPFLTAELAKLDPDTLLNKYGIALPPYHPSCRCGHQITDADIIPQEVEKSSFSTDDIFRLSTDEYERLMNAYRECIGE
jgi:SPP1 gp7 family putative phage head morphogenesis protein